MGKGAKGMAKNKGKKFEGPKSICMCGHTGDGEGSQHVDVVLAGDGQGKCSVNGCGCQRFTWMQSTKKFENFLERRKVVQR
jgi:hypothetical protein